MPLPSEGTSGRPAVFLRATSLDVLFQILQAPPVQAGRWGDQMKRLLGGCVALSTLGVDRRVSGAPISLKWPGAEELAVADQLTVKVEPFGPDQSAHDRVAQAVVSRGALREHLGKSDHRLMALELLEPTRKTARPRERSRYRATYYDYTGNRAVYAEGSFGDIRGAKATVSARQPRPTSEEFEAAVKIVRRHKELGPQLRVRGPCALSADAAARRDCAARRPGREDGVRWASARGSTQDRSRDRRRQHDSSPCRAV